MKIITKRNANKITNPEIRPLSSIIVESDKKAKLDEKPNPKEAPPNNAVKRKRVEVLKKNSKKFATIPNKIHIPRNFFLFAFSHIKHPKIADSAIDK